MQQTQQTPQIPTLQEGTEHTPPTENSPTQLGAQILIVEDTPIQAKKLQFYLEKLGHQVEWAINGKDALQKLTAATSNTSADQSELQPPVSEMEDSKFDLIITDVQMPEMDGLEMLKHIRKSPKLRRIPIVVITTLDTDEICEESIILGADDFIAKPFNPREINLRINNILQRKRSEKLVRLQLKAIESSIDGVAILNDKGEYVYVNEAQVKVYGCIGSKDIIGNNWEVMYPENELDRLHNIIWPEFEKKGKWIGEILAKRKDGKTYQQEMSLSKIEDNNKFIIICRDISERKKAEKEREELQNKLFLTSRLASIAGLAAGVAIEITTPLAEIESLISTLQTSFQNPRPSTTDHPQIINNIQLLETNIHQMVSIINGLRSYSNVDIKEGPEEVDVHKVINGTIALVSSAYKQSGTNIDLVLNASYFKVRGDNSKMGQLIIGLMDHGRESMTGIPNPLIKITTANEGDNLIITMADCGPGIPVKDLDKIFNPFFTSSIQKRASREKDPGNVSKGIGGVGLGLGLSRIIVQEMGGKMDVKSIEGSGSTFTIAIPFIKS